jgi:hypothetical protein
MKTKQFTILVKTKTNNAKKNVREERRKRENKERKAWYMVTFFHHPQCQVIHSSSCTSPLGNVIEIMSLGNKLVLKYSKEVGHNTNNLENFSLWWFYLDGYVHVPFL